MELCSYTIIWWSVLGFVCLLKIDGTWGAEGSISRRMVNLLYLLWVTAFNTFFLLAYLVVLDMWIFSGCDSHKALKDHKNVDVLSPSIQFGNPPLLLELVNQHSLAIFLLHTV